MKPLSVKQQQTLFDALKWIAAHESSEKVHRTAQKRYGLDGDEAVGMAYDDVVLQAKAALKGVKRPSEAS